MPDILKREIDVEPAKNGSRMKIAIELARRSEDQPTSVDQSVTRGTGFAPPAMHSCRARR